MVYQNVALYFICFFTPVLLQPIVNFITVRSWWDLHNCECENESFSRQDTLTGLGFFFRQQRWAVRFFSIHGRLCWLSFFFFNLQVIFALSLTGTVTQFVKITVGRPRPGTSTTSSPLSKC